MLALCHMLLLSITATAVLPHKQCTHNVEYLSVSNDASESKLALWQSLSSLSIGII